MGNSGRGARRCSESLGFKEAAEAELRKDIRRGKFMSAATQYWVRVKGMPVRQCCKWQAGQPRVE